MHQRVKATVAVTAAAVLALSAAPASAEVLEENLDGPRGVAAGPAGSVVWGEASGEIKLRTRSGRVITLGSVPGGFLAPAVAVGGFGNVYALTAGGEPGTGAGTLYRLKWGKGFKPLADISGFAAEHPDPFDLEDFPEDSNPYGLAVARNGNVLVADAAANSLLRVNRRGDIRLVARIMPRVVAVPDELPDEIPDDPETPEVDPQPLPPGGALIPSEGVATSVTVGRDGYYYLGELRGFPATPGTSQIWRIAPWAKGAVCNPEKPWKGKCKRFADGLTSIVDLAPAKRGGIYALELVKVSWFQWELGAAPIGGLFLAKRGHAPVEVATCEPLVLPGGVDTGRHGTVYLTSPIFGPGTLSTLGHCEGGGS